MNILEARRRTLGKGVYKKTVEGNPAIAQGSLARRYPGITMQGWTEQAQYEGKNLFDVGSVESNSILQSNGNTLKNNDYDTSGFVKVLPGAVYRRTVVGDNGNYYYTADKTFLNNDVNGQVVNVPENAEYLRFSLYTGRGAEIMLNKGNTLLPYEPYTGGQPSPNPDYPQEITSAGKYDEGTGKYQYTIKISDSEESPTKSQTVLLTSDRPLTKWDKLEKRNGQWGWEYKSAEKVLDGTEGYVTLGGSYISDFSSNSYIVISDMVKDGRDNAFMNRLSNIDYSWTLVDAIGFSKNLNQLHVRISNADLGTTGESSSSEVTAAMKAYIAQQYEEGNPFVFWYETAEETFAPLSESEQEQMNELYTFRPTTVLSNDCECEMTLTYKTKKSLEVTT